MKNFTWNQDELKNDFTKFILLNFYSSMRPEMEYCRNLNKRT